MGHNASTEPLLMRWAELCADPYWDNVPAKIELNGRGVIEMSPANNRHALMQASLAHALQLGLAGGRALVECSVLTSDGVRVPDVAWASDAFLAQHAGTTPFPLAPELCIEVRSPSNTAAEMAQKIELFLEAGAAEVWIVGVDGVAEMHGATGRLTASRFTVAMPRPVP
jgi:Uma2 family endonuclease